MNLTQIEWVLNPDGSPGFTSNPFTGCLGPKGDGINCPYCYAKRLANGRLKQRYLTNTNLANGARGGVSTLAIGNQVAVEREGDYADPFYPRFWPERLKDLDVKLPKGIFLCDMSDWCAPWLPMAWEEELMAAIRRNPQHRIYLLTHQPQELLKWNPFPENCFVGITATDAEMLLKACSDLEYPLEAKVKFLSIEPFLDWDYNWTLSYLVNCLERAHIGWLIIGAMTGRRNDLMQLSHRYPELTLMPYGKRWTLQPQIEWVKEIIEAADKADIPVFLKDNLYPLLGLGDGRDILHNHENGTLTQEMPE